MIRINLLPTRRTKKKEAGLKQVALLGVVVVGILVGNWLWYSGLSDELDARRREVARLQADIKKLDQIIGEITNIKKDQEALEQKLAVLQKLRDGRTGPVRMLDALATIMPDRVWIEALEEKGGTLVLKGTAMTNEDLADFMQALKANPFFSEPTLKRAVQARGRHDVPVIDFELSCGINYSA